MEELDSAKKQRSKRLKSVFLYGGAAKTGKAPVFLTA
jgi:hypothetical protein